MKHFSWILSVVGVFFVAAGAQARTQEGLITHLEGNWSTSCTAQNEGGTRAFILVRGNTLEYFSFFSKGDHCDGGHVLVSHWKTRFLLSTLPGPKLRHQIDYFDEKGDLWFSESAELTANGLSLSTDDGVYQKD